MKNQVLPICLLLSFIIMGLGSFVRGKPDALRCGEGSAQGAIYFAHGVGQSAGISYYCQVFSEEDRCVLFYPNGTYHSGRGHYQSRKGCENKTLSQLKAQNRSFQVTQQTQVLQKITQLEKQISDNAKFTSEKIKNLQKTQKEQEAKIKAQDERIQKLEQAVSELLKRQTQRTSQHLKQVGEQNDKNNEVSKTLQSLSKQITNNKEKVDLKQKQMSKQMTSITKKMDSNEQQFNEKISDHQVQIEKLLQNISSLNTKVNQHIRSDSAKQNQLIRNNIYTDLGEDEKKGIDVKPKTSLKQQSELTSERTGRSKPKQ